MMQYGTDYDLNVLNTLVPERRTATITLYRDMAYLDWKVWYTTILKPELLRMNISVLNIQRSKHYRLISSIKFTLDKNKNLSKIIGVNTYSS